MLVSDWISFLDSMGLASYDDSLLRISVNPYDDTYILNFKSESMELASYDDSLLHISVIVIRMAIHLR